MNIKKLKVALVGAGNRGCAYADYSLAVPSELEIVAVVEPNEIRRKEAAKRYGVSNEMQFDNLSEFLEVRPDCDFVINATMDEFHYTTAKAIIKFSCLQMRILTLSLQNRN